MRCEQLEEAWTWLMMRPFSSLSISSLVSTEYRLPSQLHHLGPILFTTPARLTGTAREMQTALLLAKLLTTFMERPMHLKRADTRFLCVSADHATVAV